jgi:hypothetical protein
MPVWTIAGESGKAWDATAQTMAYRQVAGAVLTFRSLATDELVLDIEAEDITAYVQPELGQIVRLYRNGSLFFTGNVTANPVTFSATSQSLRIVISGAWWWMERINYTSTQTDGAGGTATRMTGVFGDAVNGTNLQTAIQTAIDRCVTLGVPIANIAGGSSVATYFTVPRVTLNQSTCAQVISELVRLVPDTMVYFDYSTSTPTFHVTRRGVATTRTLTLGTDPVESIDVQPIYEMKVDRVELPYVERDRQGRTVFNTQSSGTAATGRVQIVTVSGPELDTFLPNDLFDTVVYNPYSDYELLALDTPSFKPGKDAGMTAGSYNLDGGYYGGRQAASEFSGSWGYTVSGPNFLDGNGATVNFSGKTLALTNEAPEWAMKSIGAQIVKVSGFIATVISVDTEGPLWAQKMGLTFPWYPYWIDVNPFPSSYEWKGYRLMTAQFNFEMLVCSTPPHTSGLVVARTNTTITLASTASNINGFYIGATIYAGNGNMPARVVTAYDAATKTVTFDAITSAQRPAVGSGYAFRNINLYRQGDYSFVYPPANLAENLVAAQNFVPYEGGISIVEEVPGGTRYRGCKVNIVGSLSAHSTMGALVAEESINLATGQTSISLGTPPRLDYRTFVDRIRKTPQDNIVFV